MQSFEYNYSICFTIDFQNKLKRNKINVVKSIQLICKYIAQILFDSILNST